MMEQLVPQTEPASPEQIVADALATPTIRFNCLNGPCQGSGVEAPSDATPGTACALPWKTAKGEARYAVYMLVDHNGQQGLMFMQSYSKPDWAQAKVTRLTAICHALLS